MVVHFVVCWTLCLQNGSGSASPAYKMVWPQTLTLQNGVPCQLSRTFFPTTILICSSKNSQACAFMLLTKNREDRITPHVRSSLDNQLWHMPTKQNKEQTTTRTNKRGISRNEAEEVMRQKEAEFRMLSEVCRMVRFLPSGDCSRIPRLWGQPRVLELLGRYLVIMVGHF